MRPLTDTLAAAQRRPSGIPCFRAAVTRRRTEWTALYDGGQDGYRHAAVFTAAGSLVRARLTPPEDSGRLYVQRVVAASPASDFTAWQDTGRYGVNAVALAVRPGEVSLFWLAADRGLRRLWSADDGQTWQGPELVDYAPASATGGLAAAYDDAGSPAMFFTDQAALYMKRYSGGVWQARQSWNMATGELTGVSAVYDAGFRLAVTGRTSAGDYRLWTLSFDGQAWGVATVIAASPVGEDYEFADARLCLSPRGYLCSWVERFTGDAPADRVYLSATVPGAGFDEGLWTEAVPTGMAAPHGLALLSGDDTLWALTAFRVWRAGAGDTFIDLASHIKKVTLIQRPTAGTLRLDLDNADDGYDTPPFGVSDRLEFAAGYITEAGAETAPGMSFTVIGLASLREPGVSTLAVEAADGWSALESWRPAGQLRWNMTHTVCEIAAWLLGRAGLRLEVLSASPAAAAPVDFAVGPGIDGLSAVRRLMDGLPDRLLIEGETAFWLNPSADDVPVYEWGGGHAVFRRRLSGGAKGGQVTGLPNCAQQLHDPVTVDGDTFRVSGLRLDYRASAGYYRMTLELGE